MKRSDPGYPKEYYRKHKDWIAGYKAARQKYDLDYRLKGILRTVVRRCEDPRHASYRWYGGKGIKNYLTLDDLKFMWERYGAAKMKKPSIDRIDSNLHYTPGNCCFRELYDNQKRGWKNKEARTAAIRTGMEAAQR
jgi:hypothetical protein